MINWGDIFRIVEPQLRQIETLRPMAKEHLQDWFLYHWNCGTVLYRLGEFNGVCVVKLFSKLEDFLEDYVHKPDGKFVMVEAMTIDRPLTMQLLLDDFKERWGPREIVLWDRGPKKSMTCPRMYTWCNYERLVKKFTSRRLVRRFTR